MPVCRLLVLLFILSVFGQKEAFAVSGQSLSDSTEVVLPLDSMAFQELVISGKKTPMMLKGDTLVFDVSCFFVPEGSKLRSLLERIPGIEVTTDGRIMAQGKEVVRIKLNGRDFFEEGKEMALNTLPADILCEVRLYQEYSDEKEYTGVHRNEGEQVLDVYTYADRSRGWFIDAVAAGGSRKRYQANATVSGFSSRMQGILSCSADNQPAAFGIGESYLDKLSAETNVNEVVRQNYNGILNFFKGPWEVNATAFLNQGETRSKAESTTEYYWKPSQVYAQTQDEKETDTETANFSLDWTYTGNEFAWRTKTYLNRSKYRYKQYSLSETRERYLETVNGVPMDRERALNSNMYMNDGNLDGTGGGITTSLNKSWGEKGSNWDLSAGAYYTRHNEDSYSHADIYYSHADAMSRQVLESHMVKKNLRGFVKGILTWVPCDPLKLQLAYGADGQYDDVDKQVSDLSYVFLDLMIPDGNLPVDSLDKQAHLLTWIHNVRALVQYSVGNWVLTGGVTLEPQRLLLHYVKGNKGIDSVQASCAVLPELTLAYKKQESWGVNLRYLGRRKQPDLTGMLPIWDCTDPLHRYVGNASLRPETNHVLSATFFCFNPDVQRQLNVAANVVANQQTISQQTSFDAEKGAYTVMPVNVDGNWNASCFLDFTTSFRNARRWNLDWKSTVSSASERALQEAYAGQRESLSVKVNSLTTTHYGAVQYKYRSLLFKPYGYMTLARYRNDYQDELNSDLWVYGWGGLMRLDFDFGLSFGIDCYRNCRSGYWEKSMNGKEWICNFEVSYSFLKNRSMEIKLQGFDVLQELHAVNQVNTVAYRQETINHKGVNSYFMLSLRYHFDRFPGGA